MMVDIGIIHNALEQRDPILELCVRQAVFFLATIFKTWVLVGGGNIILA